MAKIELIKSYVEELNLDILPVEKAVEIAGRTCYKSEEKMTKDSALPFMKMICDRGHTAMLEHATVYLTYSQDTPRIGTQILNNKYTTYRYIHNKFYVTTNFRVIFNIFENFDEAYNYVKENSVPPTEYHIGRKTFKFICDRGVSHELVRHRVMSFAQESTRYVAYDKRGFLFIEPAWWEEESEKAALAGQLSLIQSKFIESCQNDADTYEYLRNLGQTAQQARAVLPNAIKTEVLVTGDENQWKAFLQLRDSSAAHPDMQRVAKQVKHLL